MGTIRSIVYQPENVKPETHYHRVPVESVNLIANHGIEGDRKAGKNPDRHLNLMSTETLDALALEGFKTAPGEMGEQIVIQGLDIDSLVPGSRLRLGADAEIRVSKPRTGCARFEKIQGHDPKEAAGQLGVLATVIRTGTIQVGDTVTVLEAEPQTEG
jgi:MOSC domain-containing protein YiiM